MDDGRSEDTERLLTIETAAGSHVDEAHFGPLLG
jgi:hypothetical protein